MASFTKYIIQEHELWSCVIFDQVITQLFEIIVVK